MRRKTKYEIISLLETLKKAHNKIAEMYEKGRREDAFALIVQCQQCAMEIGNIIETQEGKGTRAVSCLENYCEQLYQMTQIQEPGDAAAFKRQLDDTVWLAGQEVKEKLPEDCLKVVFMPYKASMWDCMESIWEAAEADEDCQAYVVPVPYFEKDKMGKVDKCCYEGGLFPAYVPVTPYETFRLEEEQPDIVYIHNAFDGANFVTSVHPDYYSGNLKKFTDVLVYVPYFITGEGPLSETHRELPAYSNMDYMILQDDEKKESLLGYVPEEKLLVLGNPKIDHLLRLQNRKDYLIENEIPELWKEKISDKKVFLYNVSISGVLENSGYSMDKIRYVISGFAEREDAVLLWRPHPLMESTLKSMRPELYEEYAEIKKDFLQKGRGILDETADAAVSTVLADAYIGESSSSIVHYFGVLGKVVYYIDWKTVEEESEQERMAFYFHDFFYKDNEVFFVPRIEERIDSICKMNINTGKTEIVSRLPGISNTNVIYRGISCVKDKIVLAPLNSNDIYIWNCTSQRAMKLVLNENTVGADKFDKIVEYKGRLFMIPMGYPAIARADLDTCELTEIDNFIEEFCGTSRGKDFDSTWIFAWAIYKKDNLLYLASANEPKLLIFDMDTEDYQIKTLGNYNFGFSTMVYDGTFFWLAAWKKNALVRWDEKTGESIEYTYPIKNDEDTDNCFSILINHAEQIFIFCSFQREVIIFNKSNAAFEIKEFPYDNMFLKEGKVLGRKNTGYSFASLINESEIIAFDWYDYSLLKYSLASGETKRYLCRLDKKYIVEIEKEKIKYNKLYAGFPSTCYEREISESQFVDFIVNNESIKNHNTYTDFISNFNCNAGEKINTEIKKKTNMRYLQR